MTRNYSNKLFMACVLCLTFATAQARAGVIDIATNNTTITADNTVTTDSTSVTDTGDTGLTVELSFEAHGGNFGGLAAGIGVTTSGESDANGARVNTTESIDFTFDQNVDLLAMDFGAFNSNTTEIVQIRFLSGTNPFASMTLITTIGLDDLSGIGYTLSLVSTGNDGANNDAIQFLNNASAGGARGIRFDLLNNDLISILAGTVLEFGVTVEDDQGVQLRNFEVDVQAASPPPPVVPTPTALPAGLALIGLAAMRRRRS